ncbi:MAG: DUF3455 domain-containing protein [Acidobacteriaceae bacterium]
MNSNIGHQSTKPARMQKLFSVAVVLGCALLTVGNAAAQKVIAPEVPDDIKVPTGNTAFLVGHAVGTQGYTCLPTSTGGTAWNPNARPEATLFVKVFGQQVQIITHFASIDTSPNDFSPKPPPLSGNATWQSSFDTSKVWAAKTGQINGGTDDSCPNANAIPCLRLQSVGNEAGPTGGKLLANVTFVQRLYTKGGTAPTTACTVGQTQLQPYEADYYFFKAQE